MSDTWTVLLVDDEPDNLEVARFVLEFNNAKVLTAEDGQEALDRLKDIQPTFILMDLSMPVMDGWAALEHIRAMPPFANTPIIALTAHAMKGDRDKALTAGFDDYITKPFRVDTLMDAINDCLERIENK